MSLKIPSFVKYLILTAVAASAVTGLPLIPVDGFKKGDLQGGNGT